MGEVFLDHFEGRFVPKENSAFRVIGRPELNGTAGVFINTGSVTGAVPRAGLAADDYVDLGLVSGTSNTPVQLKIRVSAVQPFPLVTNESGSCD